MVLLTNFRRHVTRGFTNTTSDGEAHLFLTGNVSNARWYRFSDAAGDMMLTRNPGTQRCSVALPGWLQSGHAPVGAAPTAGKVCFSNQTARYDDARCGLTIDIQTCTCNNPHGTLVHMYKLPRPLLTTMTYCGQSSAAGCLRPGQGTCQNLPYTVLPTKLPILALIAAVDGGTSGRAAVNLVGPNHNLWTPQHSSCAVDTFKGVRVFNMENPRCWYAATERLSYCQAHNFSRILRNAGGGSFPTSIELSSSASALSVAAADVDGDGDKDVLLGNYNSPSRVLINAGDGSFPTSIELPGGIAQTYSIVAADMDGDGDIDVLLGNYNSPSRVLINAGDGTFLTWICPLAP